MAMRLPSRAATARLAIAALGLALAAPAAIPLGSGAELTVTVEGLRNAKGNVELSIYNDPAQWPDNPTPDHHQVKPAAEGSVTFKFDLPPGTYAAAGYHDENGNGKFDKSFLGLPEEGYTMSNNARPFLSAPAWGKVDFPLPASGASITMKMIYP